MNECALDGPVAYPNLRPNRQPEKRPDRPAALPWWRRRSIMMRQPLLRASIPIAVLLLATAAIAAQSDKQAQNDSAPLQLPIAGSATTGGAFTGTLSIQRFEARGTQVVAIGMVRGTGAGAGTGLVGPVALPVQVGAGSQGA